MPQILLMTLVVEDYDQAIGFYVDRLGFQLAKDTSLGEGKRWVVVRPHGAAGVCFIERPRQEAYGVVAVFEDLYGTRWDLIEPNV